VAAARTLRAGCAVCVMVGRRRRRPPPWSRLQGGGGRRTRAGCWTGAAAVTAMCGSRGFWWCWRRPPRSAWWQARGGRRTCLGWDGCGSCVCAARLPCLRGAAAATLRGADGAASSSVAWVPDLGGLAPACGASAPAKTAAERY